MDLPSWLPAISRRSLWSFPARWNRRCFERNGVRHHHVLNPRTGESPRGIRSVTILADDGLTTEALSKTVFVLGLQRGMALIESLPGVDAVVVDAEGALHFSSGLSGHGV